MRSFVNVDNKNKDIIIIGEGTIDGLDDKTLTAEDKYSINFREHNKTFCLSLHYNGANSYIFANGFEIHKCKANDSEIKATPLCLRNILKDFSVNNMKNTGFHGYVSDFSVDYDATAVDDILDIHKCLMKKKGM